MTLTEFLEERIAEDEAIALRVCPGRDAANGHWIANSIEFGSAHDHVTTKHIIRHDPARVLAECESKRRIIHEHPMMPTGALMTERHCSGYEEEAISEGWWPCPTLRALALPYADHPDYLPEWRP